MGATKKQRCTFMIEPDLLDRLRAIKARTGLSESEQIRQGIRWWVESREWPLKEAANIAKPGDRGRARKSGRHQR